jgi:CHAT domain-containing protein
MTTFSEISNCARDERRARPPWRRYLLTLAVILGIGLSIKPFHNWYLARRSQLRALVVAADAMSSRPIAARLSGGFSYRRLAEHTRGGGEPSSSSLREAGIVAGIGELAGRQSGMEAAHVAGISSLLINKPGTAVATLEEALRLDTKELDLAGALVHSTNAGLLSDLSGAYLARGGTERSLDDLAALNAAERAWQLQRTPEIGWNRALALSLTSSRTAAAAAWREYILIDPGSEWTVEAQQRLDSITTEGPATRDSVTRAIGKALSQPGKDELLRAVSLGPGYARVMAEDELLPAWGAGDSGALVSARRLGEAVAQVSGDYIAMDSAERIISSRAIDDTVLRQALAAYGKGRKALASYQYAEARLLLNASRDTMRGKGVALGGRATVFLASIEFYDKKSDASLAICGEAMRANDTKRYPSVAAQCAWNEGTVETARRRFDRARSGFEKARAIFEQMRDPISVAALDVRIQENYRWAGDPANAWMFMSRALEGGAAARGYIPLSEAARTADSAGFPFAALSFYDLAIDAAEKAKSAVELTDGHLARAQMWLRLEHPNDASKELDGASRSLAAIGDRIAAARLKAQFAITNGTLLAASQPDRVLTEVQSAIADLKATGTSRRLAMAFTVVARANLAKNDKVSAEASLHDALAEIDRERSEITTDEERIALVDTARQASESLVALLYDAGRTGDALAATEGSKARLLLDALEPASNAPATPNRAPALPPNGVAYIEYFQLKDRLLVWTVTSAGTRSYAIPITRSLLARRVDSLQQAMAAGEDVRSSAQDLFTIVLAPLWMDVAHCQQLVVVADDSLHRLSFPMLITPSEGRYLLESHSFSTVPSLAWLAAREHLALSEGPIQRAVAVAPETGQTSDSEAYAALAMSDVDVRTVAKGFANTAVLTRDQATPARFAAAAAESDLVHFAGHAMVDERRPSRSALLLSGGTLLRASEIVQWHLPRTRLVVLAGCSTAVGRSTSDGTASLARAFLLAGSPAVIATLWPVRDEEASQFSRKFYAALAAGQSGKEALRAAQVSLMRDSNASHHNDWAAFQWIGL